MNKGLSKILGERRGDHVKGEPTSTEVGSEDKGLGTIHRSRGADSRDGEEDGISGDKG